MTSLLTPDGSLTAPGKSNEEEQMETENVDEDALLRDLASDDEIPSYVGGEKEQRKETQ